MFPYKCSDVELCIPTGFPVFVGSCQKFVKFTSGWMDGQKTWHLDEGQNVNRNLST